MRASSANFEDKAALLAHPIHSWPQNGGGLLRPSEPDSSGSKQAWQQGVSHGVHQPQPSTNLPLHPSSFLLPNLLQGQSGGGGIHLRPPLFPLPPQPVPVPITPPPSFIDSEGLANGTPVSDIAAQCQAMLMVQTQMRFQQQHQQGPSPSFYPMNQFDQPSSSQVQLELRTTQDTSTHRSGKEGGQRSQRSENKAQVEGFIMESSDEESGSGKDDDGMDGRADHPSSPFPHISPAPSAAPIHRRSNKHASKICSNCSTNKTPFWRKDRFTGSSLCNACGLYASKNEAPRPKGLWKDEELPGILSGLLAVKGDQCWRDEKFLGFWHRCAKRDGQLGIPSPPFPFPL